MTRKKTLLATPKRGLNEGSRKSWSRHTYLVVVKDLVISALFCEWKPCFVSMNGNIKALERFL